MGLAELFVSDDLDIPYDPKAYRDQTDPPPVLPGNYKLQVLGDLVPKKAYGSDTQKIEKGKYPVFQINRVRILEPEEAVKDVTVFAEIPTKPVGYRGTPTSVLTDLLRAFDQTVGAPTLDERIQLVKEMVAGGQTFLARFDWEVKDSAYIKEQFEAAGVQQSETEQAIADGRITQQKVKEIYASGTYRTKDFEVIDAGDGTLTLNPEIPSKASGGGMLRMKNPKLTFIPSLMADRTPLGRRQIVAKKGN